MGARTKHSDRLLLATGMQVLSDGLYTCSTFGLALKSGTCQGIEAKANQLDPGQLSFSGLP